MHAELAYLFRHALLRDAAYELQLPGERARLHGLAAELIELSFAPLGEAALDQVAVEIAGHLRQSGGGEKELEFTRRAARHAHRGFRLEDALRLWQRAAELSTGQPRAQALSDAGTLALDTGHTRLAEQLLGESLELYSITGSQDGKGKALCGLALCESRAGRTQRAEEVLRQAVELEQACGDRDAEAHALNQLGTVQMATGQEAEARRSFERALGIVRALGNRRALAASLSNHARTLSNAGESARAESALREALAMQRELGEKRSEALTLCTLAGVVGDGGLLAEALKLAREIGYRSLEGTVQGNLGAMHDGQGRVSQALECFDQALGIAREVGSRASEGVALGNIAKALLHAGQAGEAEPKFLQALAIHRETRNRRFDGSHQCWYAWCMWALGRQDEARQAWQLGARVLQESGNLDELERQIQGMRSRCEKSGASPFDLPG